MSRVDHIQNHHSNTSDVNNTTTHRRVTNRLKTDLKKILNKRHISEEFNLDEPITPPPHKAPKAPKSRRSRRRTPPEIASNTPPEIASNKPSRISRLRSLLARMLPKTHPRNEFWSKKTKHRMAIRRAQKRKTHRHRTLADSYAESLGPPPHGTPYRHARSLSIARGSKRKSKKQSKRKSKKK